MREITVNAALGNLGAVLDMITGALEQAGCGMALQTQITVAAEEAFVNIAQYAYGEEKGAVTARMEISNEFILELSDSGKPFDPLAKPDPDITLGAEERPIGGLGIFMVKKMMDSVAYRYENGRNILTLRKKINTDLM